MNYYLASSNAGKVREINLLAEAFGFALNGLPNDVPAPDEPYTTFIENALHKARFYAKRLSAPVIAEDSGLCVPALHGAPGVYTARYAELNPVGHCAAHESRDHQNNQTLLTHLAGEVNREAYFVCYAIALQHHADPAPLIAHGFWHGCIANKAEGCHGFGYDPIFEVPNLHCTAAMLTPEQKQALSHRGQAFRTLFTQMQKTPHEH